MRAQTYPNWEAIVVDDGSTDGTGELVRSIALTEKRVRFVRRERKPCGASACRNIGVSIANGDYVIFLDSDDLLATSCLERRIEVMKINPEIDFAVFLTGVFQCLPGDTKILWNIFTAENDLDRFVRTDVPWQTAAPIWLRKSLLRVGVWDEQALSWQDWEFHIRALVSGLNYVKVPELDSFYRAGDSGSISQSAHSKRRVINRVRLFKKLALLLQCKGEMSAERRRIYGILFFRHAFYFNLKFHNGLKIWRTAWRMRFISFYDFTVVLLGQIIVRVLARIGSKVNRRLENRFPNYNQIGSNTRWTVGSK